MTDNFVIHYVLNSLTVEYEQLKVSYTVLREKWSIDKLVFVCAQPKRLICV